MTHLPDGTNDKLRAAMTRDDALDDVKRARMWANLDARLDAPVTTRRWRWAIAFSIAASAAAVLGIVTRHGSDADVRTLVAPAEATLDAPLGPHTHARLVGPAQLDVLGPAGETTTVRLSRGTLYAQFDGGAGRSLRIVTTAATIEIVGTVFAVEVRDDDTCVSVAHGRVRATSRHGTWFVATGEHRCSRDASVSPIDPAVRDALARHEAVIAATTRPSDAIADATVPGSVTTSPSNDPAPPPSANSLTTSNTPPSSNSMTTSVTPPPSSNVTAPPTVPPPSSNGGTTSAGPPPSITPPPPSNRASSAVPPPSSNGATTAITPPLPTNRATTSITPPPSSNPASSTVPPPSSNGATTSSTPPPATRSVTTPSSNHATTSTTPPSSNGATSGGAAAPPSRAGASSTAPPPPIEPPPPPAPTAADLYRSAEAALTRHDLAGADRALAKLVTDMPTSPLVDQALYERARIAFSRRAWGEARHHLDALAALGASSLTEPGRYLACRVAVEAHDSDASRCLIDYRASYPSSPHDADARAMLARLPKDPK